MAATCNVIFLKATAGGRRNEDRDFKANTMTREKQHVGRHRTEAGLSADLAQLVQAVYS
jgi:hypothetical protein